MSRVHDALRRAEQFLEAGGDGRDTADDPQSLVVTDEGGVAVQQAPIDVPNGHGIPNGRGIPSGNGLARPELKQPEVDWRNFLLRCKVIPYRPAPETHMIDIERPHEVPGETSRSHNHNWRRPFSLPTWICAGL
jgi:hypothetical protein